MQHEGMDERKGEHFGNNSRWQEISVKSETIRKFPGNMFPFSQMVTDNCFLAVTSCKIFTRGLKGGPESSREERIDRSKAIKWYLHLSCFVEMKVRLFSETPLGYG